jgi:aspartate carbamoyltransferase catalytic subunit
MATSSTKEGKESIATSSSTTTAILTGDAIASSLKGQHCLSIKQFNRSQIDYIFAVASWMDRMVTANGACDLAKGKLLVNLFYEPSTRTSSSFHAAMMRLGGMVLPITDVTNSSVAKGESLPDTVRALQSYSDVIVLRHPVMGSAALAASYLNIPLINAGDGIGEHPTQALLDTYTILSYVTHNMTYMTSSNQRYPSLTLMQRMTKFR